MDLAPPSPAGLSFWTVARFPSAACRASIQGMARRDARNVNPSLSSDPRDKLLAALNWSYGKLRHSDPYDRAPMYFDACLQWHERLSPDQQETCLTLADVVASAHRDAAESIAASLPPARGAWLA